MAHALYAVSIVDIDPIKYKQFELMNKNMTIVFSKRENKFTSKLIKTIIKYLIICLGFTITIHY